MTQENYDKATPIVKRIKEIKADIEQWSRVRDANDILPGIRVVNTRGDVLGLYISDKELAELNIKAAETKIAERINKLKEL